MITENDITQLYQNARHTMSHDDIALLMRLIQTIPGRIQFLHKPLTHYAHGHDKQRIATGALQGIEGYVMRINRDRKLVMGLGGITLAISDVHKEVFERV